MVCLTYHYPPFGGVAVQRVLRFTRYFKEWGYRCLVVCAHPPRATSIPLDPELLEEIPEDIEVHRVHTLEPENLHNSWSYPWDKVRRNLFKTFAGLLIPDDQAFWIGPAARLAARLARQHQAQVLWATGPPFSTVLAGAQASQACGLPLVADFRDDWTGLAVLQNRLPPARLGKERKLEQEVFAQAQAVVTVTPGLVQDLSQRSPHPERIHLLPNGFDPAHFEALPWAEESARKVVFYAGSLYGRREPEGFFAAWKWLQDHHPEAGSKLAFHIAGPVSEDCRHLLEPPPPSVEVLGFLPHRQVRQRLSRAALNLVWLDPYLAQQAYSGKLLEYFGVGRPILMLGPPQSPAAQLLADSGLGLTLDNSDEQGIGQALIRLANENWGLQPDPSLIEQFNARQQTGRLVELFESLRP